VKKFIIIIAAFFFSIYLYGISEASERLKVAASFYPLAHFAEQVGGERVEVTNITPLSVDPHEYGPTARDMINMQTARIFIFNGSGLDPWADRAGGELKSIGVQILNMTEQFSLLIEERGVKYDPHIWLDPILAIKEVELVRDTLIRINPEDEDYYRENSSAYIREILMLHERYAEGLASCENRNIIVSHDAFGYMARRYGFGLYPVSGLSPEEEPSPRKMAAISDLAREKNINYIFTEVLVNPKIAETIAYEIGAKILVLNPVSGLTDNDALAGKDYISLMDDNLVNLRKAMSCK
jgi:zinc transport system substrate-binding protein